MMVGGAGERCGPEGEGRRTFPGLAAEFRVEMTIARVQCVWRALKEHPLRAFGVVAFVVGFLLILVVSLSSTSSTLPSFQFLAGRSATPMSRDPDRPRGAWSLDFYSFAGDFESICAAAQAELSALGYTEIPRNPDDFFATREYRLRQSSSDGIIAVRIMAHAKLVVFSTPKNSQYSSPDRYTHRTEAGWVSVQVAQQRPGGLWQRIKARAGGLLWRMGLLKGKFS
jgi:hypothetical protein